MWLSVMSSSQEVEEILEMLKSTWRILGVTQTIHDICYTWVLFRQVSSMYVYNSTRCLAELLDVSVIAERVNLATGGLGMSQSWNCKNSCSYFLFDVCAELLTCSFCSMF